MEDIRIIVATHKAYPIPEDPIYLPVHAGAAAADVALPYQRDDTGDNLSAQNPYYCELTALYWAWKNLPCDVLGLVHYRRYFRSGQLRRQKANASQLQKILCSSPLILPKKRHYWIETNESQYVHAHGFASLDMLLKTVGELYPDYLPALQASLHRRSGHRFNMFIMTKELADRYCEWLFDILFALESSLKQDHPEIIFPRIYGFLSERLMDCWVETNHISYRELPVLNTEKQHWPRKIADFLKRKFHP